MIGGRRSTPQGRLGGRKLAAPSDPPPYIGFPIRYRTILESHGTLTVPIVLSQAVNFDVSGTLVLAGGSVRVPDDCSIPNGAFTITAGSTFTTVNMTIVQDATIEPGSGGTGYETARLKLQNVSGALVWPTETTPAPPATPYQYLEILISDDDVLATTVVQWEVSGYSVTEESSYPTLRLVASQPAPNNITVDITVQEIGAELGVDFDLPSGLSYTILAGQSSVTVPVTIIDDAAFEGAQIALLSIDALTSVATVAIGPLDTHSVTITDDTDIARVRFPLADLGTVIEGGAGVQTQLNFNIVLEDPVQHGGLVVGLSWGGTAIAGEDYIPGPSLVQIGANQAGASFSATLIGDGIVEPNETIVPTIISVSAGGTIGSQASTTLTVLNDDSGGGTGAQIVVNWRFLGGSGGGWYEEAGNMTIEVELSEVHSADVTVTYQSYGSELEGAGYLQNPIGATTLVVPAGQLRASRVVLLTPFAFDGHQGLIVFLLTGTTVGSLGPRRRMILKTKGVLDVRPGVPQLDTYPGTVDIEVYTDRYEIGGVPTVTNRALEGAVRAAEAFQAAKNPTPLRVHERGVLTVLRVHGDHYAARNGTIFQWGDDTTNPDNAYWTGSRVVRDLLIIGADANAVIPGIVHRTKIRPSLGQVQIVDNVHFASLTIKGRDWKVTDFQPGPGGFDAIHGRIVFYNCKEIFDRALYEPNNARWINRWVGKASAEWRDCEFGRTKEHVHYYNDPQGLLIYNCRNDLELDDPQVAMTSGKSFMQVVSREAEAPGAPACGLVAVVQNHIEDIGIVEQLGGADLSVNGGGEATYFFAGNDHVGQANGGAGARAIIVVNTLGTTNPQQLTRSFNFDDTGQRFVTRKVIIETDEEINCTGTFGRDPIALTGCFEVEIRGFQFTSYNYPGPRISANSFFSGPGYPNRGGGWSWGSAMGATPSAYGGWGALGTGFKMRHGFTINYGQSQNNAVALSNQQIDFYDGGDP